MGTLYLDSGGAATNSGTSDNNSPDLSGSANATVVSNKTFVDGDVNTGTDQVTVTGHGYASGTGVELTTSGVLPAGLTLTTLYYLFAADANTISCHTNVADAEAGTNPVNITAAAGGGTHTINNMTVNLGGTPDLSGVVCSHTRLTTTGTSHVFTTGGGVHGLTTGERTWLELSAGGTMAVGLTEGTIYYANALSTTTFRVYSTRALAVAGGASDINVSAAEVRTLTVRGALQSAIALASASNTNRKIFWARAVSNTNDLVILAATVTGLGAGSNWAIGGRVNASGIVDFSNAIRRGDNVVQNTDITITSIMTPRNHEAEAFGGTHWHGKAGARRLLSSNTTLFSSWTSGAVWFKNLEVQNTGASGSFWANGSGRVVLDGVRISDCGGDLTSSNTVSYIWIESEVSGAGGGGGYGAPTNGTTFAYKSYFHDNTGKNIGQGAGQATYLIDCILERCTLRNVDSAAGDTNTIVVGSTLYRADNSGLETTVATHANSLLLILDSILKDNGNAAGEANIKLANEPDVFFERNNCVNISGGRGGDNTVNLTLDGSDITTDPLFVDPDNGTPGSRNFNLDSASPAKGVPYTFLGSGTTSYVDLGAVQRQEAASGGGLIRHPGMAGGLNA